MLQISLYSFSIYTRVLASGQVYFTTTLTNRKCGDPQASSLVGGSFCSLSYISLSSTESSIRDHVRSKKHLSGPRESIKRGALFLKAHPEQLSQVSAGCPKKGTYLLLYSSWALGAKPQSPPPCADLVLTGGFSALWPWLEHFWQPEEKLHQVCIFASCPNTLVDEGFSFSATDQLWFLQAICSPERKSAKV